MLKLGIIGCGRIVESGHVKAWLNLRDRVQVTALADPTEARRAAIGDLLNVPEATRYADFRDMLQKEQLDAVDIAVPHFLHEPAATAAARAGVHIILEKPVATNLDEAQRILDAVETNNVKFSIIHNYKYQPANAAAIRLVESGAIGTPFLIRDEGLGGGHYPGTQSYDPDWRTRAASAGGGCLIDNAYHNLYLADHIMLSPVVRVYARVKTYVQPIDVDDTALVFLEHANGGTSSIQVSWAVKGGGQRVREIHGTRGSIRFDYRDAAGMVHPLAVFDNNAASWSYPDPAQFVSWTDGFTPIFDEFVQALEGSRQLPTSGTDARRNLAIVMAAYESAQRGVPVDIPGNA